MKKGFLSEYFRGVASKTLSAVEADRVRSNQHEFNGVTHLKSLFGQERRTYVAKFIYLNDNDDTPLVDDGKLTWYDARFNNPNRSEFRLYFSDTFVSSCASAGDTVFIAPRPDDTVLVVIAESGSTIVNQLNWLFGLSREVHPGFSKREELETEQDRLAFASRLVLETLGIEVETEEATFLDEMIEQFNDSFPTTFEFSAYARKTLPDILSTDNPDTVLLSWMEREEILFRTFEKHLIAERLSKCFSDNVETFISFSLSVQNRRKARVGFALENHVEELLKARNIRYSRNPITEGRSKPDFVFPGENEYKDLGFSTSLLNMLGVKSTCKDRWRQVLAEADRIENKHLLTLEAAISENQTNEMKNQKLQLVVPRMLHETYTDHQQKWLMTFEEFVQKILENQRLIM